MNLLDLPLRGTVSPAVADFVAMPNGQRNALLHALGPTGTLGETGTDAVVILLLVLESVQAEGRLDLVGSLLSAVYHAAEASGEIEVAIWARRKQWERSGGTTSQALIC